VWGGFLWGFAGWVPGSVGCRGGLGFGGVALCLRVWVVGGVWGSGVGVVGGLLGGGDSH